MALGMFKHDDYFEKMILEDLQKFLKSELCCMTFSFFFTKDFRNKIEEIAEQCSPDLKTVIHYKDNGLKYIKVYKSTCNSYLKEATLKITGITASGIFKFLEENLLTVKERIDLDPGYQKGLMVKPRIQIHRFSLTSQQNIAIPTKDINENLINMPIFKYRQEILNLIDNNQVAIINIHPNIDKLEIPRFILQNANSKVEHCRILYANVEQLASIKNSHVLAKRRNESVGYTIGYQIRLQSVSSSSTNLLFTSTSYFLRCIMGINSKDVFYGISHIILDDIEERDYNSDLLLFEIKEVLGFYPNLKVILLNSMPFSSKPFQEYFNNAKVLDMYPNPSYYSLVQEFYLESILYRFNYITPEMEHILEIQRSSNSIKSPENILNIYKVCREDDYKKVDHSLVLHLIKYILENFDKGTILVILPFYEDILRIEYMIKTSVKTLKKNKLLKIYKLYKQTNMQELEEMLTTNSTETKLQKIILSTSIADGLLHIDDAVYVIDSGIIEKINNSSTLKKTEWISKPNYERRKFIAGCKGRVRGLYFLLYSVEDIKMFPLTKQPKLMIQSLDKICLLVKLLSPYTTIKEYLSRTICTPSSEKIDKSIKFLNDVGAFEEKETVTILGVRIVDIPLDIQLSKVLIFSILMQCLDPVLTIISCLTCKYELFEPSHNTINISTENLVEHANSDHLTFLRIFQNWQDERLKLDFNDMTKEMYLLDQHFQSICETRTEIVGIVRSAQLIHSNGILSMNFINSKGNNWGMVKACFVAGMYPNIYHIEKQYLNEPVTAVGKNLEIVIKTRESNEFLLDSDSRLNHQTMNKFGTPFETEWFISQGSYKLGNENCLKTNTLITPITMALFAGNMRKSEENIITDQYNSEDHSYSVSSGNKKCYFVIDDWIKFSMNSDDAYLLFNLRQKLSHMFLDLLENCSNTDNLRMNRSRYTDKLSILEILSKILYTEDEEAGFQRLERIGERPKALLPLSSVIKFSPEITKCEIKISDHNYIRKNPLSQNNTAIDNIIQKNTNLNMHHSDNNLNLENDNKTLPDKMQNLNVTTNEISKFDTNSKSSCDLPNFSYSDRFTSNSDRFTSNSNSSFPIKGFYATRENTAVTTPYAPSNSEMKTKNRSIIPASESYLSNIEFPIVRNKLCFADKANHPSNVLKSAKYFILKCLNDQDALEYFTINKSGINNSIWDDICLDFFRNPTLNYFVFLYNITTQKFHRLGLVNSNGKKNGFRLQKIFKADFSMDEFKRRIRLDFLPPPVIPFGEIPKNFGEELFYSMYFFETNT